MRILFLEHFSRQDLDSLVSEIRRRRDGWRWRELPWQALRLQALKNLPDPDQLAFEDYSRPELQPHWAAHARHLETVFEELYSRWQFDAFVAPSDIFYYVRGAAAACERLGIPFVVVQKETTVSPGTMAKETVMLRDHVPFLAHHMTVCSDRHRDYWLATGADPARISVTGQPRFDAYFAPQPPREGRRRLLFLSYHLYAYAEAVTGELDIWRNLHTQTEAGLWELARRGWEIVIKPHPQQPNWPAEVRRMRAGLGRSARHVRFARLTADTRDLILEADAVVGFQSTALLEAMIAGKPVVYTGWDPRLPELEGQLIPFHTYGDVIEIVENPDQLVATVEGAPRYERGTEEWDRRAEIFVEELGPVDGRSSARVLDRIEAEVAAMRSTSTAEQLTLRERLQGTRAPRRLRDERRVLVQRLRHYFSERFPRLNRGSARR